MAAIKFLRVQSATLVESIIALVIITTITGIAVMIFTQSAMTSFPFRGLRADAAIEQNVLAVSNDAAVDTLYTDRDIIIQRERLPYPVNEKVLLLKITVSEKNGDLIKQQKVIMQLP